MVFTNDNIYNTLSCVQKTQPDTVIMDPALLGNQLIHFIHVIMKFNPSTKFVLLPASDNMTLSEDVRNEHSIIVISSSDGIDKSVCAINGVLKHYILANPLIRQFIIAVVN